MKGGSISTVLPSRHAWTSLCVVLINTAGVELEPFPLSTCAGASLSGAPWSRERYERVHPARHRLLRLLLSRANRPCQPVLLQYLRLARTHIPKRQLTRLRFSIAAPLNASFLQHCICCVVSHLVLILIEIVHVPIASTKCVIITIIIIIIMY